MAKYKDYVGQVANSSGKKGKSTINIMRDVLVVTHFIEKMQKYSAKNKANKDAKKVRQEANAKEFNENFNKLFYKYPHLMKYSAVLIGTLLVAMSGLLSLIMPFVGIPVMLGGCAYVVSQVKKTNKIIKAKNGE